MNRRVLLIIVPALLLVTDGCRRPLMNLSPSSFLSNFSLEELVKRNRSPSGTTCAKGGRGGGGSSGSTVGIDRSSVHKGASFSCETTAGTFDEVAFIDSLRADVEQEINRSGATITNRGSSEPGDFYFEYIQSAIHGRVTVRGKESGPGYYSLESNVDEKREGERK